ncbi:pirin family protein [Paenibacillus gansuensis]|uniref:Pirin family protein n=1 Tax=Paenibacillus gansuensis TaxID=306542 RepID=A0ABW5PL14_9BACL
MIRVYKADTRYFTDHGWLQSNFSFSFADHYDPENMNFGPMRVLNDDIIQAGKGFGAHPHHEMEIVSLVLRGKLRHQDSLGNTAVTGFGQIQRMSAGTGIVHSEFNPSEDEDMNLLQMWFMPSERGLAPSYETTDYDPSAMVNRLLPVVSKEGSPSVAKIHQDMTIYLSKLEAGKEISFTPKDGRRIFLFVLEGAAELDDGTVLERRDSARMEEITELTIRSSEGSFVMMIDLP